MSQQPSQSRQSAAHTARKALHLLTKRGLPPTPENYAAVYAEISGVSMPVLSTHPQPVLTREQRLDNDRELVNLLRTLVSAVTERTGDLAESLDAQNRSMKRSISALEQTDEKKEILAVLQIISATAHAIQRSVEDTHNELVQTKNALETMRQELQETRQQLMLDPLTGARNRFGMEVTLSQEIARARRSGNSFTIALIDLDHFKAINDSHGHDVGDQVLLYFTQLSKAVLRESDVLFRYGGEEFLVLLPDTERDGAVFMLERLQQMLQKSPLHVGQKRIHVTFSAGVAELAAHDNASGLIQRADRALYRAKRAGRHRIEIGS